jgi:aldehyde dehydrogenase (NAD+)
VLDDANFVANVAAGVGAMMGNSGQTCSAPSRLLVPKARMEEAIRVARETAASVTVGDPNGSFAIGPVVSKNQFEKIQGLIKKGVDEGATLVAGGPGRPAELNRGYYVRPTVFANVTHDMRIAREEIFGPVLSIMPYDTVEQAVEQANDTVYGLASYIQAKDIEKARDVAARMRSGNVYINYPTWDAGLPFGGYKQSGNGREYAEYGLEDFLEIKGIAGYEAAE